MDILGISINLIIALAWFLMGCIFSTWRMTRRLDGRFFVNLTDPEDEMFRMQIDIPLEQLPDAKYLIFKVEKTQ